MKEDEHCSESPPGKTVMKQLSETPYSVLDLSPIRQGGSAAESFRNSLDLARHAERWGYTRYWVAEHHNLPGVASAATSVVIGHIAGGSSPIRPASWIRSTPDESPSGCAAPPAATRSPPARCAATWGVAATPSP